MDINQRLRNRIEMSQKALEQSTKTTNVQYQRLKSKSPGALQDILQSIEQSLKSYAPFPESTLLLAFKADRKRVEQALRQCARKVLSAPINEVQFQWFMEYVFPSPVLLHKNKNGQYLYEEMLLIVNGAQKKMDQNMESIFVHLQLHPKWKQILSIPNQSVISRQDDEAVGLLQESGIRDIAESKDSDGIGDSGDLKKYIDSNLALNVLMNTANRIDDEFQREMNTILGRFGDFESVPMLTVYDAIQRMERDPVVNGKYPTSAMLLDPVRCSVSYNTIEQLLDGFGAFMDHIESGNSSMKIARVQNGFLSQNDDDDENARFVDYFASCVMSSWCEVWLLYSLSHFKEFLVKNGEC